MFYVARHRVKPALVLAPFIDIVFLLLIFFMVATVFPENDGIAIEKPKSDTARTLPAEHMLFALSKTGDVYYEKRLVARDELKSLVATAVAAKPNLAIIVKADTNVPTGDLLLLLDEVRKGGAKNIALAAEIAASE